MNRTVQHTAIVWQLCLASYGRDACLASICQYEMTDCLLHNFTQILSAVSHPCHFCVVCIYAVIIVVIIADIVVMLLLLIITSLMIRPGI